MAFGDLLAWDIEHERVAAIRSTPDGRDWEVVPAPTAAERPALLLSDGWTDVQINGACGIAFNSDTLTPDEVHRVTEYVLSRGTASYCPTLITDSFPRLEHALRVIRRASEEAPSSDVIVAIHLEGPYISPEDGPRGAHPRQWVRPPDKEEFCRLQEAAGGLIGLVTLAPEVPGALEFVAWLRNQQVIPAIGHTAATPEQIFRAVDNGALLATHVSNAASELQHRHRSNIYAQLADDRLMASFIADGHHVPPWVLKVFLRAKTVERSILVSDLMHWSGLPPGRYTWDHLTVEVTPEGAARIAGEPRLAGATAPLSVGILNAVTWAGLDFRSAVRLVTANVRRLLHESRAARTRLRECYTLFEAGETQIRPRATVVAGRLRQCG